MHHFYDKTDLLVHTFEQACVLVTLTFALSRAHLVTPPSGREASVPRRILLLVFLLAMALTEELVARQYTPMSARVVAACASGLLGGPLVGGAVGFGAAVLRQTLGLTPPVAFGAAMTVGGIAGGLIRSFRPRWALRSWVGLILGASVTLLRYVLTYALGRIVPGVEPPLPFESEAMTALVNGAGVVLILKVVEQVRTLEETSRAAALAEVRALQARMSPHFLFNALNSIAALSSVAPESVPAVVGRLGRFLRGSLELHERPAIPLRQELEIVTAYLDVETVRFGDRLRVETSVDPSVLDADVPPFCVQPLVENAVRHGLQPAVEGGVVRLSGRADGPALLLTVEDTGVGLSPEAEARLRGQTDPEPHALSLLRRRLTGLYGDRATLVVRRRPCGGTIAEVRLPLNRGTSRR